MKTGDNKPPGIVEKLLLNKVNFIGFDAEYTQTAKVLTLCSMSYFL